MSRESTSYGTVLLKKEQVAVIDQIVDGLAAQILLLAEGKIDHAVFVAEAEKFKGELFLTCVPKQEKIPLGGCCSRFEFSKEKTRSFALTELGSGLFKGLTEVLWCNVVLDGLAKKHPSVVENNSAAVEELHHLGEGVVSPDMPSAFKL